MCLEGVQMKTGLQVIAVAFFVFMVIVQGMINSNLIATIKAQQEMLDAQKRIVDAHSGHLKSHDDNLMTLQRWNQNNSDKLVSAFGMISQVARQR